MKLLIASLFLSLLQMPALASPLHGMQRRMLNVVQFQLINAATNEKIADLVEGAIFSLNDFNMEKPDFNLVAIPEGNVDSVTFNYNGIRNFHEERFAPYALCGNTGSSYNSCTSALGLGSHTVAATTIDDEGKSGSTLEIKFDIVSDIVANNPGQITQFQLINTDTNEKVVDDLVDKATISLFDLKMEEPTFNLVAVVEGGVDSVTFDYNTIERFRTERVAPYALCGDQGDVYYKCRNAIGYGFHTIVATPFRKGVKGSPLEITFEVVSTSPTDVPATDPVSSDEPTSLPDALPKEPPSLSPTEKPTTLPSGMPSPGPFTSTTFEPTSLPDALPTEPPSLSPTEKPTPLPSGMPSPGPFTLTTFEPTSLPDALPTEPPSLSPTGKPTSLSPTGKPTTLPSGMQPRPFTLTGFGQDDGRILRFSDGAWQVDYFGDKDETGAALNLRSFTVGQPNIGGPNQSTTFRLDEQDRPEEIFMEDGGYFRFDWTTFPDVGVTYIDSNETSTFMIDLSEAGEQRQLRARQEVKRWSSSQQHLSRQLFTSRLEVQVQTCGLTPVENANVNVYTTLTDATGNIRIGSSQGRHIGGGNYEASTIVNIEQTFSEVLEDVCGTIADVVNKACTVRSVIDYGNVGSELICLQVGLFGTPAAGLACGAAFGAAGIACDLVNLPNGQNSIKDLICDNIESEPTFTPEKVVHGASVMVPGDGSYYSETTESLNSELPFLPFLTVKTGPGAEEKQCNDGSCVAKKDCCSDEKRCNDGSCVAENARQCSNGTCKADSTCCSDQRTCFDEFLGLYCNPAGTCCSNERLCNGRCVIPTPNMICDEPTAAPTRQVCESDEETVLLDFDDIACDIVYRNQVDRCPYLGNLVSTLNNALNLIHYRGLQWWGVGVVEDRPGALSMPNFLYNRNGNFFLFGAPAKEGGGFEEGKITFVSGYFQSLDCESGIWLGFKGWVDDVVVSTVIYAADYATSPDDYTFIELPQPQFSELTHASVEVVGCKDPNENSKVSPYFGFTADDITVCKSFPTKAPTIAPTTEEPTKAPTPNPTKAPTPNPTEAPTNSPSALRFIIPSVVPSIEPSLEG